MIIATRTPPKATAMPTTETTTTKRQTWTDWFPDSEPRLTFHELDDHIRSMGLDPVAPSAMRFWQKQGLVPYPVRRRRGNTQYALYPSVALAVIERIRNLQRAGLSLEQIRPLIRGMVATWNESDPLRIRDALMEAAAKQAELGGVAIAHVTLTFTDTTGVDTSYQYYPSQK
jgi:DNA-binding transcriptional MerR regulator